MSADDSRCMIDRCEQPVYVRASNTDGTPWMSGDRGQYRWCAKHWRIEERTQRRELRMEDDEDRIGDD